MSHEDIELRSIPQRLNHLVQSVYSYANVAGLRSLATSLAPLVVAINRDSTGNKPDVVQDDEPDVIMGRPADVAQDEEERPYHVTLDPDDVHMLLKALEESGRRGTTPETLASDLVDTLCNQRSELSRLRSILGKMYAPLSQVEAALKTTHAEAGIALKKIDDLIVAASPFVGR